MERRFHFDPPDEVVRLLDLLFNLPRGFSHTLLYDMHPSVEHACSRLLVHVRPYVVLKTDTPQMLEFVIDVISKRLMEKKNEDSDSIAFEPRS